MNEKANIMKITRAALFAALYAVLTIALAPISYGPLQFRVAEAMTVLPAFFRRRFQVYLSVALSPICSAAG